MLEVRNLLKRYNRIPAVDGVSFTIRPGEILGYVGPNGAGKSTTVKVLTGLIDPTAGEILFGGRDVRADWVGFQRRMGYVPEEPHLYPHLTGREYLQLVGRLRGLPRCTLEPRMDRACMSRILACLRHEDRGPHQKRRSPDRYSMA